MENNSIREFTCNDCQEVTKVDWSKVRPDIDDGTSHIKIYQKGNDYAYYGECMNCGNLVEIEPPVPELEVTNVDVDKDGMYIQLTDVVTNRSCWVEAWQDKSGEWEYDFNQYIFHLDSDNDIVVKMFQEDLGNYSDEVFDCVMGAIDDHEEEYNKLQENKALTMRDRLKEARGKKEATIIDKAEQATEEEGHIVENDEVEVITESEKKEIVDLERSIEEDEKDIDEKGKKDRNYYDKIDRLRQDKDLLNRLKSKKNLTEDVTSSEFNLYIKPEELSDVNISSLLFDSNTVIADYKEGNYMLSLIVRGDIKIYDNETGYAYKNYQDFPVELQNLIKAGALGSGDETNKYTVDMNNWFEWFLDEGNENVWYDVADIEGMLNKPTPEENETELEVIMKDLFDDIVGQFKSEEDVITEASFNDKVKAIKRSLKKNDKRLSDKTAEKSVEKIAGSIVKNEESGKMTESKTADMDTVSIVMELEGGELTITDVDDWNKVKSVAREFSRSQGFYGRLLRDMLETEEEFGGVEYLPYPITM